MSARLLAHALLALGAALTLAPFAWMLLTSLRAPEAIYGAGPGLGLDLAAAAENYARAWHEGRLARAMANGVLVCGAILALQLLFALPAAFALAKLRFPGRGLMFALVLFGLCVPMQVPALPLYLALAQAGLLDSYAALILPFALTVFGLFLFRQFFRAYPDEVLDAARLDGMGAFEMVWRLAAPAALPAIAAFSVFSVVAHWNDLYWPLVVVTSPELATPPLGILAFRDAETGGSPGALMAGATLVTLPLVLCFLAARRAFLRGLTLTGPR